MQFFNWYDRFPEVIKVGNNPPASLISDSEIPVVSITSSLSNILHQPIISLGSVMHPVIAQAAAVSGLASMVRAPGP